MPRPQTTVHDIRRKVEQYQGHKVRLEAHKSKKKLYQKTGFIQATYPSVFTVSIESKNDERNQIMSFSYIDLLTKNVKIDLLTGDGDGLTF